MTLLDRLVVDVVVLVVAASLIRLFVGDWHLTPGLVTGFVASRALLVFMGGRRRRS